MNKVIIDNGHYDKFNYRQRMSYEDWKQVLLDYRDTIIYRGNIHKLIAVDLGFGVVEVFKLRNMNDYEKENL